MKILTKRERNRRKYLSIYKSIENKMHDNNLLWWLSLSMRARYSFVFKWIDFRKYLPSCQFKHFLKTYKFNYKPSLTNKRNAIIEHFLK